LHLAVAPLRFPCCVVPERDVAVARLLVLAVQGLVDCTEEVFAVEVLANERPELGDEVVRCTGCVPFVEELGAEAELGRLGREPPQIAVRPKARTPPRPRLLLSSRSIALQLISARRQLYLDKRRQKSGRTSPGQQKAQDFEVKKLFEPSVTSPLNACLARATHRSLPYRPEPSPGGVERTARGTLKPRVPITVRRAAGAAASRATCTSDSSENLLNRAPCSSCPPCTRPPTLPMRTAGGRVESTPAIAVRPAPGGGGREHQWDQQPSNCFASLSATNVRGLFRRVARPHATMLTGGLIAGATQCVIVSE